MGRKRKARVQCDQDGNEYHDDPMGYGESPAGGVHLREDRSSAEHVSKRQCVQGRFVLAEESSSGVSSLSIRHQSNVRINAVEIDRRFGTRNEPYRTTNPSEHFHYELILAAPYPARDGVIIEFNPPPNRPRPIEDVLRSIKFEN